MQVAIGALQVGDRIQRPGWNTILTVEQVTREVTRTTIFTKESPQGEEREVVSYSFYVIEEGSGEEYLIDPTNHILVVSDDGDKRVVEGLPMYLEKVN